MSNEIKLLKKHIFYIIIILVSLFTVLSSISLGMLFGILKQIPPPELLEHYSPPQVTRVFDRTGNEVIAEFFTEKRVVLSLKEIPDNLKNAFISIEDVRFYNHIGVDLKGITRAMVVNIRRGSMRQGASTITQQLSRNVFEKITNEKTLKRKLKEALFSFYVEKRYSKEQILEFYLNQIYLGNGAYGVGAAARKFFNKDVKDLTVAECAVIAGIPQRPSFYSPLNNVEASKRRRNAILSRMFQQKYITKEQYEASLLENLVVKRADTLVNKAPYFIDYIKKTLTKEKRFSGDALFEDGYNIYTTLDVSMQDAADKSIRNGLVKAEVIWQDAKWQRLAEENKNNGDAPIKIGDHRLGTITTVFKDSLIVKYKEYTGNVKLPKVLPYFNPQNIIKKGNLIDVEFTDINDNKKSFNGILFDKTTIQGAIVVLGVETGDVLAMTGGYDYYDDNNNGKWNRAIQGGRQAGSGVKPLFFAAAIDNRFTAANLFIDKEVVYSDGYTPINYEDEHYGPTTLQEALEHSRNVVSVLLMESMGANRIIKGVKKFDFAEDEKKWNIPVQYNSILGLVEVTPLELAAAYTVFPGKGIGKRPYGIRSVTDQKNKEVKNYIPYEEIVISPQSAYIITTMLRGVVLRGTGKWAVGTLLPFDKYPEVAGKTGTTNDCVDSWFTGYTPEYLICVYVGMDQNRSLGPAMTGSRLAAPIFTEFVKLICEQKKDMKKKFDIPDDITFLDICSESGKLWTNQCGMRGGFKFNMAFKKGTEPTSSCTVHSYDADIYESFTDDETTTQTINENSY